MIETYTSKRNGNINIRLTECPVCNTELKGGRSVRRHIMNHQPEDFGLSPLTHE